MGSSRILVAEDDLVNRESLVNQLAGDGHTVFEAGDGHAALQTARTNVDVALLDIGLPGIDGLEVLRTTRREGMRTPIIMMSGRSSEVDRVVCFELGADDFVPKPFFVREVMCRVNALLRRSSAAREPTNHTLPVIPIVRRFGRLEIDETSREVRVDGADVHFSPRDYQLFAVLAQHHGVALSRRTLIELAWGFDYDGDERRIDGHIRRIRRKLEEECGIPACVSTVYGFGYKFTT